MNFCNDRHEPIYKIKYTPVTFVGNVSEWLVCDKCFGRQEFFDGSEDVESIVSLRNCMNPGLKIDHLSIMTGIVTTKLKNCLLIN